MSKWVDDGGHGGIDGGANAKGNLEKVYTLEASQYVSKRLNQLGIFSQLTRNKDETLSNAKRTEIVRKYDRCNSHHYNAGGGAGVEVIHSIHSDGKYEKMLIEEFKKAGYPTRKNPIYTRTLPSTNKKDYYFMHRETGKCETTIIEYDFVDGANSEKIKSKSYREGMYECVVKAVARLEGKKYVAPKSSDVVEDRDTFHRVVAGSFNDKKNADKRVKELKSKGFESFIEVYKK